MKSKISHSSNELKIALAVLGASIGVIMIPVANAAVDHDATAQQEKTGPMVLAAIDAFIKMDDIKGEKNGGVPTTNSPAKQSFTNPTPANKAGNTGTQVAPGNSKDGKHVEYKK